MVEEFLIKERNYSILKKYSEIVDELKKLNSLKEKELKLKEDELKFQSYWVEMDTFDRKQKTFPSTQLIKENKI